MKRNIALSVSILAVAAVIGWKVSKQPESTTGLHNVKLIQHSELSHPGPTDALAGIRIRLSPSDLDDDVMSTTREVPQVAFADE